MRSIFISILVVGVLLGCSHTQSVPDVVHVPVPVSCVGDVQAKPQFQSDAELLALTDYGLVVSLARERRLYQGWTATLEAILAGCR